MMANSASVLADYPKPDKLPNTLKLKISPFDTEVAAELSTRTELEHLTFIVPSGMKDCRTSAFGLGYHLINQLLSQWDRLPLLKTATIRAKNQGTGLVKWPKHAPPQIVDALSGRSLDELVFERAELPVQAPYPAKLFGKTNCAKLVFWKTHMYLTDQLYGDMVGVELSKSVEALQFLDVDDEAFMTWVLSLVPQRPQGRLVAVKYRHREREFESATWRALSPNLGCIRSLAIEMGQFVDEDGTIWKELAESPVRDLQLEHPTFINPRAFQHFLDYIEGGPLESVRITGRVLVATISSKSDPFDDREELLEPTRMFLVSVGRSNISWMSFPYTDCAVGMLVAEAIPNLKLEVLDLGLFPPKYKERNPGSELVKGLQENKTIGAFKCDGRKKVAMDLGIVGLGVRAVVPDDEAKNEDDDDWVVFSHDEMDWAATLCRRNQDEYYHTVSQNEFK